MIKLLKGKSYDVDRMRTIWDFGGVWPDGYDTRGYHIDDYFDASGRYLGPDIHGVEPLFPNGREHRPQPKGNTTMSNLTWYDLDPRASELWVVEGPRGFKIEDIDPDNLPDGFRWVGEDEWEQETGKAKREPKERTMIIKAKFNSICPKCGGYINAGSKINWERGQKATHVTCPEKPINAGPQKTGQLWEPCPRCGSEPIYMPLHICESCWPVT